MSLRVCVVVAGLTAGLNGAWGQEQVIASLPFSGGLTAGPNATDYPPPNDAQDLWVIEDFGIATDVMLSRFESLGTVFPAPLHVTDVTVRIYDAMPPAGNLILSSVPGHGSVAPDGKFKTDFGGQFLGAGSYFVVWNASTAGSQVVVLWAQPGAHAVGDGLADNAWLWNPNGGWGYPDNLKKVPADLQGTGQTGVNFTLFGSPALCYANCDSSTAWPVLDINDFQCFVNAYAAGQAYANCDGSTLQPVLNVNDFQCFLNRFAGGCI